jgi:hypothetical protein
MIFTLFIGGVNYIAFTFSTGQLWGYIMDVLLLVALVAGVVILWQKSRELTKWQMMLEELRGIMFN